jgi:heat-inducible transcriptional repressor
MTSGPADLNHRARKILQAVINEYLATGEAVGSRTITRRYGVDLSPATVRNVMSDLEESGLLVQPHTSAGRVPTASGLRFFVDSLLKVRSLSAKEREELQSRYALHTDDVDAALREATRVLSELSTHTVVLLTPRPDVDQLDHLEFMRMRDKQVLAVLVTKSGQVLNKIVNTDNEIQADELERMGNYVKSILKGLTLDELAARIEKELESERLQVQAMERRAMELSRDALPGGEGPKVIVEGQVHLLEGLSATDPEQLEKLKGLFRALEEKRVLADLLERTAKAPGIFVFFGAETQISELSDFSLVASSYGPVEDSDGRALGTLGVIGPTRMNYSRVINLVDFTAQLVSGVIGKR